MLIADPEHYGGNLEHIGVYTECHLYHRFEVTILPKFDLGIIVPHYFLLRIFFVFGQLGPHQAQLG